MSVVRADRIGESRKLDGCSLAGFLSYAYFVAALRDDFGRFRFSARLSLTVLAPRDRADLDEQIVRALLDEYRAAGLLQTWEQDGVTWAEWTGAVPRGNRFHRTPEPPWSTHTCTPRCEKTGRAMAKRWGNGGASMTASGDTQGSADVTPGDRSGEVGPSRALPFSPSPPSPSTATTPPQPPSAGAEGGAAGDGVEDLVALAARLGGPALADQRWQRARRRSIRARLKAGEAPAAVRAALEQELAPPAEDPAEEAPADPQAERMWDEALARLEGSTAPHSFASWLRPTRGVRFAEEIGGRSLVVACPSAQHLAWLSGGYARPMLATLRELCGDDQVELRLVHGPGPGVLLHAAPEAAA